MLKSILLALLLQAIPVRPNEGGTITGVLLNAAGKPAAGVRVGAIAQPESVFEVLSGSSMVSLGQTDEAGRYRLDDVPPGRYYIAAGRVDLPTYYPGTQDLSKGRVVSITSKAVVGGIDFTIQDSSVRLGGFDTSLPGGATAFSLPLQVTVDGSKAGNDSRLPVFSPAGFVFVRLTNTASGVRTEAPVNAATMPMPDPAADYKVTIENLPPGFGVKAIMADTRDITGGTLKLPASNFQALALASAGLISTANLAGAPAPTRTKLSITLNRLSPSPQTATSGQGVRVAGQANRPERRSIYISGTPGFFYSDGTFEFRGVPPGRHTLVTIENPGSPRPLGASIVVGNRDIEGVQLEEIRFMPVDARSQSSPGPAGTPAGTYPPGSSVPLASLKLAVVDEATGEPAGPGTVYVMGPFGTSFDLQEDAQFEIPKMVPGKYIFEIRTFRHSPLTQTIEIGDENVNLKLSAASEDTSH